MFHSSLLSTAPKGQCIPLWFLQKLSSDVGDLKTLQPFNQEKMALGITWGISEMLDAAAVEELAKVPQLWTVQWKGTPMAPMAVVPLRLQLSCHLKKSSLHTLSVDIGWWHHSCWCQRSQSWRVPHFRFLRAPLGILGGFGEKNP